MTYKGTSTSDTFKKLITSYSEYGQDEIFKVQGDKMDIKVFKKKLEQSYTKHDVGNIWK